MRLVPTNEPLQAEVMVRNEDAGFVREGQNVKIKLTAYPFQQYGMIQGNIVHLGADAEELQAGSRRGETPDNNAMTNIMSRYKALVRLETQTLIAQDNSFELAPGMQVVAEIDQGMRSILEYLLSPIRATLSEAARER
jgi:hemolysin D